MRQLCIDIKPLSFTTPGVIYNTDTGVAEQISIAPADGARIANCILENNIDQVQIFGNLKYTTRLKNKIETELGKLLSSYSTKNPIEIELKGVVK